MKARLFTLLSGMRRAFYVLLVNNNLLMVINSHAVPRVQK